MIGSNGIHNDVEQRVDLYRNKPQELQQRYAMSQELIDLLALQKLTAEKKAVAQHMALQAGAGGKPPTIAQQREQEAMQLTKQEVTQQQAGLLQQQQAEKQKRMQEMVGGGLGSLPAPNVATPQAMAAGGIVDTDDGYANGGDVRGVRNNNPGNLIYNNYTKSLGAIGQDKDGFAIFPDPQAGAQALTANLRNYASKGINTVESIINRWSPATGAGNSPESTRNYANFVAKQLGVSPDQPLDMADPRVLEMLNASIQRFEGGPGAGIVGLTQYAQAGSGAMNDASPERAEPDAPEGVDPGTIAERAIMGGYSETPGKSLWQSIKDLVGDQDLYNFDQPELSRPAAERVLARDAAERAEKAAKEQTRTAARVPQSVRMSPNAETDVTPPVVDTPAPPAPPPAPKGEAGLAALVAPPTPQGPGLSPQDDEFRQFMKGQIAEQVGRDPLAEADAEQQRALAALAMSPEQLAARQRTLEGIAGIDTRRFDPERMRREELQRFLIGMGGRSSIGSVAQGATAASINYRNEMEGLERAALGQRSALEDKFFEDERGIRKDAFGARGDVRKEAEAGIRQGTASGSAMSNTDMSTAAQREIAEVQRESNRLTGESNRDVRLLAQLTPLQENHRREVLDADKRFAEATPTLAIMQSSGKALNEVQQRQYDTAKAERDAALARARRTYELSRDQIMYRLERTGGGPPSSDGFQVREKPTI